MQNLGESEKFIYEKPNMNNSLSVVTSMPSLFIMALSIFKMAAFIVRGGGSTVKPMFIAFDRLASSTVISFFPAVS